MRLWRYLYGENPLHLLAVLACFALTGYAVSFWYDDSSWQALLIWFAGAVIGHDLVLYPLYALADQPVVLLRWARRRVVPRPPLVPAINHIRLPVLGSAVLGLIYLPTITAHAADSFAFAAGHPLEDHYTSWLGITGLLFLVSAVLYALRLGAAGGRGLLRRLRRPGDDDGDAPAPLTAGTAVAAPVESPAAANGHSPAESSTEPAATVHDAPASHDVPASHDAPETTEPETTEPETTEPETTESSAAEPTAGHAEQQTAPTDEDDDAGPSAGHDAPSHDAGPTAHDVEAGPAPGDPVVTNEAAPTDDDTHVEPSEENRRPVDSAGSERPSG